MKNETIKRIFHIPDFQKENRLSPQLQFLLKLFTDIENDKKSEFFEIHFGSTSFCSCFFLGILHSIIYQLRLKRKVIHVNDQGKVFDYLNAIHFNSNSLIADQNQLIDLSKYQGKSYLPIMHFPTAGKPVNGDLPSEACLNVLLDLIYKRIGANSNLRNDISFIISEITDNVLQHSESDRGVIFAQYYSSKNILDIVIADFGQGILNSYKRNSNFSPETNEDALRFALEGKSSKDDRETRGFGLEESRNRIMNRNDLGRFMMWSGDSLYIEMTGVNEMINLGTGIHYNGCIVFIRLCC